MGIEELLRLINERAKALNCQREVAAINSVIDKVRYLQSRERYVDCFAWEDPFEPSWDNPRFCAIHGCCWKPPCDILRSSSHKDQGGGGEVY